MERKLSLALFLLATAATAQTERAAFTQSGHGASLTFATDYQCIGINPANLAWPRKYKEKKVTFGIGELGYSLTSSAFDRAGLKDDLVKGLMDPPDDFTYAEKVDAAKQFDGATLGMNADAMQVGVAFFTDSAGGFAFTMRDRVQWYSSFNTTVAQIMFEGYFAPYFDLLVLDSIGGPMIANDASVTEDQRDRTVQGLSSNGQKVSKLMDGSAFDFLWYREYGLSYGRKLSGSPTFDLYGGLGVKYLSGFGMIQVKSDGGEFIGQSALSPGFDIDYGADAKKNPSHVEGDGFKSVGKGFAVDIGLSAVIHDKVKIGLSYVDLGSITWDGNVYVAADSSVDALEENGFDNYNFFDQADNFSTDVGIFEWNGVSDVKVKLPSTLRTGVGYVASDKLELGFETVLPMNEEPGAYRKAVIALGADYRPAPWISLNTGLTTGGLYPARVPFGVVFAVPSGAWEAGFALRDVLSLGGGGDPTLSGCFGLLRFRV